MLSLEPARKMLTVKHEEIKGFMPAMTMPYEVRDAKLLDGLEAGDLINATLVVVSNGAYLSAIKKVGRGAARETAGRGAQPVRFLGLRAAEAGRSRARRALRRSGRPKRTFSDFKGSPVVMTFIYTKCPLPTFCPLMDRHFATLQTSLQIERRPRRRATGHGQLRSGDRYARRAQGARETAERGPRALDVSHRRSGRDRSVCRPIRRVDLEGDERRARHHAQPANGDRRRAMAGS